MNLTHRHLMLNHLPVLGIPFGFGLLLYGVFKKSEELKRTALGTLVIIAVLTIPAYLTGESAEEAVKSLPGVEEPFIEKHDDAAAIAFTALLALGVTAFVGLIRFRGARTLPSWFTHLVLATSVVVGGLMAWTANLGGQIRHTEIRPGAVLPATRDAKDH